MAFLYEWCGVALFRSVTRQDGSDVRPHWRVVTAVVAFVAIQLAAISIVRCCRPGGRTRPYTAKALSSGREVTSLVRFLLRLFFLSPPLVLVARDGGL